MYENLYPDLHKKAMYFGVELFHAAIIGGLLIISIIMGISSGSWFLLGISVFYWAMAVKVNDRTRFYDIKTRIAFFCTTQQEFKW